MLWSCNRDAKNVSEKSVFSILHFISFVVPIFLFIEISIFTCNLFSSTSLLRGFSVFLFVFFHLLCLTFLFWVSFFISISLMIYRWIIFSKEIYSFLSKFLFLANSLFIGIVYFFIKFVFFFSPFFSSSFRINNFSLLSISISYQFFVIFVTNKPFCTSSLLVTYE